MWILPKSIASVYSAEPLGSTWESNSRASAAELSLTWRGKPMPAKSWLRAWKKATWIQRLFGRMCQPSTDAHFGAWWAASLEASLVKTSVSPESRRESKASVAGSGSSLPASSPKFSLDWSSLKTSRPSARTASKSSSRTLPRSGSMQSGVLSERPILERLTIATDSSFWPTPDASVSTGNNRGGQQGRVGKDRPCLARMGMYWQTPRATDGDKGGPNQTSGGQPSLVNQARRMWPTAAAAHDAKDTGAKTEYERKSPGPTATGLLLQMQMSGARLLPKDRTLNPRFVEWLMGWPIGWTNCDSQVTEWFLFKPLKL